MTTAKTDRLLDLPSYAIRPALVEAMLMTEKHAGDAIYMATLAEELRNIEVKIAALEEALHLGPFAVSSQHRPCRAPKNEPDAGWIREKSGELHLRFRRIEKSARQR